MFFVNSDRLSSFMESRGAPSPGILALTSNLSKVCVSCECECECV